MALSVLAGGLTADELLQAHPVATFLVSHNGIILLVNQAAEQLANMGRTALVGRPLFDIVRLDPEQEARLRALDQRAYLAHGLAMEVGHSGREMIDLHFVPLGDSGQHLLTLSPVIGAGEFLALGGKSGARSATAAASMLAHEIKNPLAGIRGAAQLIARQQGEGSKRFTDLIVTEVDRIAALIDRMQQFSRGQPLECTPTNIYLAIAQVSESMRAAHPQIRMSDEFDPSIPLAQANHDAVVQILMNLLGNAADALSGQPAPAIRVSTSYRQGLLLDHSGTGGRTAVPIEICVADNGPGVDADLVEAMFEPFVTTKRDGQGLGLALVARLARDMNGAVQYRRKDGWSQFRLHLPSAGKQQERD